MASSSVLKSSFRLVAAAFMISGYVRVRNLLIDAVISDQYGGHSQYLTMQGLAIAVATMLTGVVVDLLPFLSFLRVLRRYLFVTAMPLAVVITSIYWTLLLLFPKLIVVQDFSQPGSPSSSSEAPKPFYLPLSIDLALHACPAIALMVDFFAFESKYTASEVKYAVPAIVACYCVFYGSWVEYCATKNNGIFPYPFLTHSPLPGRIAIYVGASLLAVVSFRFLNWLHPRSVGQ
ncbi:hypothetical protein EST38_g6977 [Candolleomyces aberdarensis]|uniref:FAR-17a/AIG1-like protein n=1 Tax=Candolleomyces aberdarensis TaxID=2316362 RepID=A0A4Q2DIE5_9AGAR|nr:hypothetical protein EST38_g6977 [Candolleomyces aberdarensis]